MDERIVAVIKATAKAPTCEIMGETCCCYCDSSEHLDTNYHGLSEIKHEPGCKVLLARALCIEWGMPLGMYYVSYEWHPDNERRRTPHWRGVSVYTTAFSEDDALSQYRDRRVVRNMRATYVCPFPEQSYMEVAPL